MGVLRLAHVDITVTDLDLATAYYTKVIGMIEVQRQADSVYLKCWDEADHHSLRLSYAPRVGFDQMSFKVERSDDLADFENAVTRYGFPVDVGPTRHGITRGSTIYFFDPLGTRNEVFTGGYRPDPDFPTITWTEDNAGRAIFYYEGELNDRFMKVHT